MGEQDGLGSRLTLAQAAKALGLSTRTLRRRVGEGKLSATKELRGEREVWTVDGAELARYAQSTGQTMALAALAAEAPGHEVASAASAASQAGGTEAEIVDNAAALAADLDKTRHEKAALEAQVAALAAERDWLRTRVELAEQERLRLLDALPKALPPARSLWARLFRGNKGEDRNG
jgi:hypothetical protein